MLFPCFPESESMLRMTEEQTNDSKTTRLGDQNIRGKKERQWHGLKEGERSGTEYPYIEHGKVWLGGQQVAKGTLVGDQQISIVSDEAGKIIWMLIKNSITETTANSCEGRMLD